MKVKILIGYFLLLGMLNAATIKTDKNMYNVNESITISTTEMSGDAHDWIAIYPQGSSNAWANVIGWSFTNGVINYTKNFGGLDVGNYEVRAFFKNTYVLEAQSSFSVQDNAGGNALIETSKQEYTVNEVINSSFKNMSGDAHDWIGIYAQGSTNAWENVLQWSFTKGLVNGSKQFQGLPAGNYEIRVFFKNSYVLESKQSFSVKDAGGVVTSLKTSKNEYTSNESITVNFQGMSGDNLDWMAIYPKGSSNAWNNVKQWAFTKGVRNGSKTFQQLPTGEYEVRAFFKNTFNLEAQYSFVVKDVANKPEVLILYDTAGDFGFTGKVNAMFLENLLGHFDINIISKPATNYVLNELSTKKAVFYVGTSFDVLNAYPLGSVQRNSYENFYKDIATYNTTVVWLNYNLPNLEKYWKDNNLGNTTFAEKYGMSFSDVAQLKYNRVKYKNVELYKGVIPFATPGSESEGCLLEGDKRYACSLELNRIKIVHQNKVNVFATTYSTINNGNTPETSYIAKAANNFWFVGDIPFTYMSEEDRYLAFADVLHDMLNIYHVESHKAIMRLEDVDAHTNMNDLNSIATYMGSKNIPFSVATIARYEDPLGIENDGVPATQLLSNSEVGTRLKELYDAGAITIVQHGTTHQYHKNVNGAVADISNPYNGLSGDDFEFMRVIEHADLSYSYLYPVENDSKVWAKDRITQGISIFNDLGISAFAWEAPHYMAGPNHYRAIAEVYPVQYARVLYFPNEDSPDIAVRNKFIGQFYPYIIKKDLYGYTIIPENIHNIEDIPNPGYRALLPADTIKFAKKLKVVRDGVASFYYHPYLQSGYLKQIVEGLQAEGYTFVSAPTLVN